MQVLSASGTGANKHQASWAAKKELNKLARKYRVEISPRPNVSCGRNGDEFLAVAVAQVISGGR